MVQRGTEGEGQPEQDPGGAGRKERKEQRVGAEGRNRELRGRLHVNCGSWGWS